MQDTKKIIYSQVIIRYVTLFYINSKRCLHITRSYVVLSVAYLPKVYIHIYHHGTIVNQKLKYQIHNSQNRRYDEMASCIFETYQNYMMPLGSHIYQTLSDMYMATMCSYPLSQHVLTHWKCALRYCEKCPRIAISSQE